MPERPLQRPSNQHQGPHAPNVQSWTEPPSEIGKMHNAQDYSKGPLSDRFWLALWDAVACGGDLFCFTVVDLVVAMKCGWIVRGALDAG